MKTPLPNGLGPRDEQPQRGALRCGGWLAPLLLFVGIGSETTKCSPIGDEIRVREIGATGERFRKRLHHLKQRISFWGITQRGKIVLTASTSHIRRMALVVIVKSGAISRLHHLEKRGEEDVTLGKTQLL